MKIRFIHTADLHLETPFKGLLDNDEVLGKKLQDATYAAFMNIVDACISRRVDFLVIAGDIFDSETKSIRGQLKFIEALKKLSDNHIPVYFNCGNHDFLDSWSPTLHLPPGVHRFGKDLEKVTFIKDNSPAVDIYGISFAKKEVKENLSVHFKRRDNPSPVSIAVLHGTIGPAGAHHYYAPFTLADILKDPFDYWALGHIHNKSIVYPAHPMVVYPGNPQGRDFGETGAKGCYLVEIETGRAPEVEFIPTEVIRFEKIVVDISGMEDINSLPEKIAKAIGEIEPYDSPVSLMLRLTFIGKTILHSQLNTNDAAESFRTHVNEDQLLEDPFKWIARIDVDTKPDLNLDEIRLGTDFPAETLQAFERYAEDTVNLTGLVNKIESEFLSVPAKREILPITIQDEKEILEKAKWLVLDQILTKSL